MEILVDSCVILDILTKDPDWFLWSSKTLEYYADNNVMVINPIIYYEVFFAFDTIEQLDAALPETYFRRAQIPWAAALLASKRFGEYRSSGRSKNAPLPDFIIGAHAAITNMPLITRLADLYKEFFPEVQLITP